MTTHPIIRGPGQLLATIPALLGFVPHESLVVIGMRGAEGVGVMMRVDRADCLIPEVVDPLARSIAAHLARDGATGAIVVSYTGADVRVGCDAADAVRSVLQESLDRIEQWAVADGRFFFPGCADDSCCPADGLPLPPPVAIDGARLRVVSAARHERTAVVAVAGAQARRNAGRAIQRWRARKSADPERWREKSWALWVEALALAERSAQPITPSTAGKIVAALQDLRVRDAAVLSLVPGSDRAAVGVLHGRNDTMVAAALSTVLEPAHAVRPDSARADAARMVCAALCAHAPRKQRAPMITILAFMAWWDGDATRATHLCDQALSVDPGYTLAELLDATIRCHLEPGWLRGRSTNTTKPDI